MRTSKKLKLFYLLVRIAMLFLLVVSILGIIIRPDDADISRSIFVIMQSLILLVLSFGPSFVAKKFNLDIPDFMESMFLLFLILALVFGEIAEFFVNVLWWDDMLHTLSGLLVAIVGFSIINSANRDPNKNLTISPLLVAVFVFSFSMTVEVVWELFEYTADSLIPSSNMMRTIDSQTLIPLSGLAAIEDTMSDITLAFIASLSISVLGFLDQKYNWNLFSKWIITPSESTERQKEEITISEKKVID